MAKKIPKKSYNAEKTERRDPWDFSTSILSQNIKKLEGDILGIFFRKKCHNAKKLKRDPLVSPGTVCYAEKEKKPFWFSSLGQMIQFGTIKICITFENYIGQFVGVEKRKKKSHYNSRDSLHEAPTKNTGKKKEP